VEQITNALIYKFMSDMDLQSVEVGGKASFFVEGYEQYAGRSSWICASRDRNAWTCTCAAWIAWQATRISPDLFVPS
jgi:hypothetical protein